LLSLFAWFLLSLVAPQLFQLYEPRLVGQLVGQALKRELDNLTVTMLARATTIIETDCERPTVCAKSNQMHAGPWNLVYREVRATRFDTTYLAIPSPLHMHPFIRPFIICWLVFGFWQSIIN